MAVIILLLVTSQITARRRSVTGQIDRLSFVFRLLRRRRYSDIVTSSSAISRHESTTAIRALMIFPYVRNLYFMESVLLSPTCPDTCISQALI